jgi:polyphosphate kinase 2 (PPK2 family)
MRAILLTTLAALLLFAPPAVADGRLPAVAKTKVAKQVRDRHIKRFHVKYAAKKARGTLHIRSPRKLAGEKKIRKRALALNAKLRSTPAKRPVLIILEGSDGTGKSSTIRRLLPAFEGARKFDVTHFGAPPAGMDDMQLLRRYIDKIPEQGGVMIMDRSWYGQAIFRDNGEIMQKVGEAKKALREINHLEALIHGKVKVIKVYLDAGKKRQAKTIGKREALAPEKLGDADYAAYRDRKIISKMFKNARSKTGKPNRWNVIQMNDRIEGRLKLLDILEKELF